MKKSVLIVFIFIILLFLFTFQRMNGFFVYNQDNNISIPESFVQDISVKDVKLYDENNNGMIDKIELENKFDNIKINSYNKKRVIISLKDKQLVKELNKNEIEKLLENPEVLSITQDSKYDLNLQDTVPLIGASNLHLKNINSSGETICILDSGIYSEHTAFTNKILNEYCYSDDDYSGNGFGYCYGNNEEYADASDDLGHGTLVAGIVNGIAKDSKLVVVKICSYNGQCYYSDLIKGINYCIDNKEKYNISVITLSLGTSYVYNDLESCNLDNIEITNVINKAYTNNIFVDISSGNSRSINGISAPACLENVTAVGATDKYDNIASYSNIGDLIDVSAPGSNVNTTSCIGPWMFCNPNGYTSSYSGTSFASPHVAGAAALLIQYAKEKYNFSLSPNQIKNILKDTGKQIDHFGKNYSRISLIDATNYLDSYFNESLDVWTDLDHREFYYFKTYLENITFYANFSEKLAILKNESCVLNFDNNSYNMSFNDVKNIYEYSKFINNFSYYNYSVDCYSDNVNLSKDANITNFSFYLNHSLKIVIKDLNNEPLSGNLLIYEYNPTDYLYNETINNEITLNLTEFLVLDNNFVNKTPHKIIVYKDNISEERELLLNDSLESLFVLNISSVVIPSTPTPSGSSGGSGGGGGSSGGSTKKENKVVEKPKTEEKKVIEPIKEENTRFLELQQEPAISKEEVKTDTNWFITGLYLILITLIILAVKLRKHKK